MRSSHNPGDAREVVLHVMLQYGDGAPAFFRGSIGLEGAAREGDGYRVALPANSVHFATLVAPAYQAGPARLQATLHAAIFDAATGARIGDPCSTRFDLAAGGEPVLEFGLRRAQGPDGGLSASRAAHRRPLPSCLS